MSTYALHHGANERRAIMLEKLGGREVLREAIEKFYERQMSDERLLRFFQGVDVEIIKWHQFNLMSIAFTHVPDNFDVADLILNRHQRLFDMGLCEYHFDLVKEHFTATLNEMNVNPALIDEAVEVFMPLRAVFEQGARDACERKQAALRKRHVVVAVVAVLVAVGVVRFVKRKK